MAVLEHEPITANENEKAALRKIEGVLRNATSASKLVGPGGEEIELPASVFQILRNSIYHMIQGEAISIVPVNKELTTQEAADLLNVSRPYLVKLLEQGKIPFIKVGNHRRIKFNDLIAYKKRREEERRMALDEMAHISEDAGLYD